MYETKIVLVIKSRIFMRRSWSCFLRKYGFYFLKIIFFKSSHRRCSIKFRKIYREAPVLESLFNKVAELEACTFIKKRLQHWCFSVNIAKLLRTPILKNICERLLLIFLRLFWFCFIIYKLFATFLAAWK